MTTNTSPAGPDRRVLHAHDPAELLAETRICLRQIPTDCLVLVGHDGDRYPPLITCSGLADLMAPEGRDHLEHHLGLMQGRGSTRAFAVLVVGNGYEELPESVLMDVMVRAGGLLLSTAQELLPEPFGLDALWAVGGSSAFQVLLTKDEQGEGCIAISPPSPLREFSETHAAAGAVFTGNPIPQDVSTQPGLEMIGRSLDLPRTDLDASCDPGELFAAAREALRRLRAQGSSKGDRSFVTDCEHVSALLSVVAVDRLHWELLAQCVEHGNPECIDRDELLQVLVSDPQWSPDLDVCAGGDWYETLERLRFVAAAAVDELPATQRATAREAWRGLTAMLVMLAWWNHRFATAGRLVDELWEREPESTLAPLLARMTDTPIFPAWWPST